MKLCIFFANTVCAFGIIFLFPMRCNGLRHPTRKCEPVNVSGCKCKLTNGSKKTVDPTSYGNTHSSPGLKGVQGSDGNPYSYNPCNGFDLGRCSGAAVCVRQDGSYQLIGDAGRTQFQYNEEDDSVLAAYRTHKSVIPTLTVKLVCDPNACDPVFSTGEKSTGGMYNFEFTSVCACPGMCDTNGPIHDCQSSSDSNGTRGDGLGLYAVVGIGILSVAIIVFSLCIQIVRKDFGRTIHSKGSSSSTCPRCNGSLIENENDVIL